MARISIRLDDGLKRSLTAISKQHDISKSELVRQCLKDNLDKYKEDLPDHLKSDFEYEQIKEKNKHKIRGATLPNNVATFCDNQLDSKHPIPPELIDGVYFDSIFTQIETYDNPIQDYIKEKVEYERERYINMLENNSRNHG